jgi:hypothetical protein
LAGCPNPSSEGNDDDSGNGGQLERVTLTGVADLSKIAAATGGVSASSPLEIVFTSAFTDAGFAGLVKETDRAVPELDAEGVPTGDNITATFVDPLGKLYDAIGGKYVVLNMAESGWTGMKAEDDPAFFDIDIAGNDAATSKELRGDARDRVVKIILPKKLKVLGANMFCYSAGLKEVSFSGCSELTEISTDAFRGSTVESLDFSGCTALRAIGRDAFSNCRSLKGTNNTDTLDLTPLTSLEQIGRSVFAYAPVRVVKFPAVDALDIDDGACRFSPVMESAIFAGSNLIKLAMNNFMYYDQPNNQHYPYHPDLKVTHMGEITDGAIGPKNDKVYEIFYPESLSFLRTYQSYFNHQDDDGYFQGTTIIPTKNGEDAYRGQASMLIQADVTGAPSGTVDVYSKMEAATQYKVGTMANGKITLTAPAAANLAVLDQMSGMEITGDPHDYFTSEEAAKSGSGTKGRYDLAADQWSTASAGNTAGAPVESNTGYLWQPWIGNNAGNYNKNSPAKFIHAKTLYYQAGGSWKKISRQGYDMYTTEHHYSDGQYYLERHDISYVYVDQDVTIKRNGRFSNGDDTQGAYPIGDKTQVLYEVIPVKVNTSLSKDRPWRVNFPSQKLSLKKGWNQIETVRRYPGDAGGDWTWSTIRQFMRVSAGIMGRHTEYSGPTSVGYNTYYNRGEGDPAPTGPRKFSDDGNQIQVPWVVE